MATPESVRKKSPRAPSISLDEALDRALKVYDKERLNPASPDVVAQGMGYKDANNGRALATLASVRYYGLIERHSGSRLSVTKDVENYRHSPSEEMRQAYLRQFVAAPALFSELLDRYPSGLPSDGNLRYELIQRGFLPATAEGLVGILRRSFEFARIYDQDLRDPVVPTPDIDETDSSISSEAPNLAPPTIVVAPASTPQQPPSQPVRNHGVDGDHDRIPVRLSGGRRAWLLIPPLFREADKQRLKAQIDLLLTDDEDQDGLESPSVRGV